MSKQELTEVEELRRENKQLRIVAESHQIARDYALRTAEQLREELNYKVRCNALEQLCRDLYKNHCANQRWHGAFPVEHLTERMDALGLLEGVEHE